jgi:translation initiation factor 3 subunit H
MGGRFVTNRTRERLVPRLQVDGSILRCIQKIQLQYCKVSVFEGFAKYQNRLLMLIGNSLTSHRLTFSSILEEVPLKIRTNPLLSAFLGKLSEPSKERLSSATIGDTPTSGLGPSFSVLDLGTGGVTRNLEQIVEAVDNYRTEEGNLSYMSRQIARERAKAENYVAKRKEENAVRVAQGLAPLPEEDVSRLFKIPAEPSRLESLLLLGQIDAYGKSLAGSASTGLVKMYAANAGSDV